MDFIFGLPPDKRKRTGIVVFVDRPSKMIHLAPVAMNVAAAETAHHFVDTVFRYHGLPDDIVSDRDVRFTSHFWRELFGLLNIHLSMSVTAHPETDGQTERVNPALEDVHRSYATSFSDWSDFLPLTEFALNTATHASTGLSPFFMNHGRYSRVSVLLLSKLSASTLSGGGAQSSAPVLSAATRNDHSDSVVSDDGFSTSAETIKDGPVIGAHMVVADQWVAARLSRSRASESSASVENLPVPRN